MIKHCTIRGCPWFRCDDCWVIYDPRTEQMVQQSGKRPE